MLSRALFSLATCTTLVSCAAAAPHVAAPAPPPELGDLACAPLRPCEEPEDAWPSIAAYRGWSGFDFGLPVAIDPRPLLSPCAIESGGAGAADEVQRWTRDERGLVTGYEVTHGDDVELRVRWEHDAEGRLVREEIDRHREHVEVNGKQRAAQWSRVDGRAERASTFSYDGSEVREAIDEWSNGADGVADALVVRTLDARGDVVRRVTYARCEQTDHAAVGSAEVRAWTRDAEGRALADRCDVAGESEPWFSKQTTYGPHGPIAMDYARDDEFGERPRQIEFAYEYDESGRETSNGWRRGRADGVVVEQFARSAYELDAHGRVTRMRRVEDRSDRPVEHVPSYDEAGRLTSDVRTEGTYVTTTTREYDPQGRLVLLRVDAHVVRLDYECEGAEPAR